MRFSELTQLDSQLKSLAEQFEEHEVFEDLVSLSAWIEEAAFPKSILKLTSKLTPIAMESSPSPTPSTLLAKGALIWVHKSLTQSKPRTKVSPLKFVLTYAEKRIIAMSEGYAWKEFRLSPSDEQNARAFYDLVNNSTHSTSLDCSDNYNFDDVCAFIKSFIDKHKYDSLCHGKLADNLAKLLDYLAKSPDQTSPSYKAAQAAIVYFYEQDDAIRDDTYFGLLDDQYIADQTLDEIYPRRGDLNDFRAKVNKKYPFLESLEFGGDEGHFPMSEFVNLSAGMLLEGSELGKSRAVMIKDSGPLPYILSFIQTLAYIYPTINTAGATFRQGDHLIGREGSGVIVFQAYGIFNHKQGFVECSRENADYIQYIHEAKSLKGLLARSEWNKYKLTTKKPGKRFVAEGSLDDQKSGVLERIFHLDKSMPALKKNLGAVLMVVPGQVGQMEQLGKDLLVYGKPISHVVPTAHLRIKDDDWVIDSWTHGGKGGEPMVCVVSCLEDALEALMDNPLEHRTFQSVVVSLQPGSDNQQPLLARIVSYGVPMLVFVTEGDHSSFEYLSGKQWLLWSWSQQWFESFYVRRTPVDKPVTCPLSQHESQLRQSYLPKTETTTVNDDQLDACLLAIDDFEKKFGAMSTESYDEWIRDLRRLSIWIVRSLAPPLPNQQAAFSQVLAKLRSALDQGGYAFSAEFATAASKIGSHLAHAYQALSHRHGKFETMLKVIKTDPHVVIWMPSKEISPFKQHLGRVAYPEEMINQIQIVSSYRSLEAVAHKSHLMLPAWYGRERMNKILTLSGFAKFSLLLHQNELAWYKQWKHRNQQNMQAVSTLVLKSSAIPQSRAYQADTYPSSSHDVALSGADDDKLVWKPLRDYVRKHSEGHQQVRGKLVKFVGDHWAIYTLRHKIFLVSHLISNRHGGELDFSQLKMRKVGVDDLEVDDVILYRKDNDADVIRELAHELVDPQLIEQSQMWKRALTTYLTTHPDHDHLRQQLNRRGCKLSATVITSWLDDARIGPQQAKVVLPALAEVTGDRTLSEAVTVCLDAIMMVRQAHYQAGKQITAEVMSRVRQHIQQAGSLDNLESIALSRQLRLLTVDSIEHQLIESSPHLVNRPCGSI